MELVWQGYDEQTGTTTTEFSQNKPYGAVDILLVVEGRTTIKVLNF